MTANRIGMARARARLQGAIRSHLAARGFDEVETPCLVPAPGMEPHIRAFEAPFVPEAGGDRRRRRIRRRGGLGGVGAGGEREREGEESLHGRHATRGAARPVKLAR